MDNVTVVKDELLSSEYGERYVVINAETGQVLDNAQGYGYKSIRKAYAAYAYRSRNPEADTERYERQKQILEWLCSHPELTDELEFRKEEIRSGILPQDTKINAKTVREILTRNNIKTDFTPGEILKSWQRKK